MLREETIDVERRLLGRGLSVHCSVMPKAVDIEPERRVTEEPHRRLHDWYLVWSVDHIVVLNRPATVSG